MIDFEMGNEESHASSVDLEKDAIEVTDNWTLYCAHNVNGVARIRSAFVSQGSSDRSFDSLKRLAKNLMIHRHPCIIQYISSWSRNDSFYLITEEVKPLAQVIGSQSALQICIGLHSILRALTFLHEKARSSHNNLCCASIYVTPEGVWKLGGLDYLMKFSDVTPGFLQESRAHRYEKAVPPEEDNLLPTSKVNAEAIDEFAFGVLVEEVLRKKSNDEIPHLSDFRVFCKKKLHSVDPSQRSKLTEIMSHQFFSHDFIRIHKFLSELPLKSGREKEEFFRELTVQLSMLPEDIVASQLASLLLSRIVILDETAQQHLLPIVLQPKTGDGRETSALFSENTFSRHIVPKLLQMFCVRDAQVRLILLKHFRLFCNAFTTEQLKHQVLPELLIGIKDVDDQLVSTTLKALADLVLVLGASTVIGGKRAKMFTDGRPKAAEASAETAPASASASGHDARSARPGRRRDGSPSKAAAQQPLFGGGDLPERLSPDGGEDRASTTTVEEVDADGETWSDWESPGEREVAEVGTKASDGVPDPDPDPDPVTVTTAATGPKNPRPAAINSSRQPLPDISTLDIKSNLGSSGRGKDSARDTETEIDFFRDMEPVISKTQAIDVNVVKNKFDINVDAEDVGSEWDDGWALDGDASES